MPDPQPIQVKRLLMNRIPQASLRYAVCLLVNRQPGKALTRLARQCLQCMRFVAGDHDLKQ